MHDRIRVGIVDFLNSRPLAWGFLQGELDDRYEAIYVTPSRVADLLAVGEIDAGLVPAIEVVRLPGLEILPGPCVAATREVRSVLLLSRVPLGSLRRIAADTASRTSQALVRILLRERCGNDVDLVPAAPTPAGVPEGFDAALIIGDPALKVDRESFEVVDLAASWRELTGLPFVFAVWAVRGEKRVDTMAADFGSSLASGLASMDRLVEEAAASHGLAPETIRSYLTHNLRFHLGPDEIAGLREFYRLAEAHGLTCLPAPADPVWQALARGAVLGGSVLL